MKYQFALPHGLPISWPIKKQGRWKQAEKREEVKSQGLQRWVCSNICNGPVGKKFVMGL